MTIVIVGGGIAGLAIGWRLAQAGAAVEILERGIVGRGATWASAGMLAPGAEVTADTSAIAALAHRGREQWPRFAAELEAASGVAVGFRETGSLIVAENDARAHALETLAATPRGNGAMWLAPSELQQRETLLSPSLRGALHVPHDAQVDNRALGEALRAALIAQNVSVRERCVVHSLIVAGHRLQGVVTAEGAIAADAVILACGAWTSLIGGVAGRDLPPVRPAKGQMAALRPPEGSDLPRFLIWSEDIYLVPRGKTLFVGATVEDASFDTSVTRAAYEQLITAAAEIVPSIRSWTLAEMWAGLRPRTPDDAPVLGPTHVDGLYVAGGQFRNGILFAPAIADAMRDVVLRNASAATLQAFAPGRFVKVPISHPDKPGEGP